VEDQTGRGTGKLLIREAQERYEFLIQLGGNEATRRTIPTVCCEVPEQHRDDVFPAAPARSIFDALPDAAGHGSRWML
jgi:hypothetical protein